MSPRDITIRLKSLHTQLKALEELLEGQAGSLPLKDEVEIGQVLWRIGNVARAALSPFKESLREEAAGTCPGSRHLRGRTDESHCTVTSPPPNVRLRPEVTFAELEAALGPELSSYFLVQVQVRPDFHDQVEEANPKTLAQLARLTDTEAVTPRVTFRN